MTALDAAAIRGLLLALSDELGRRGLVGDLYLVGGAALVLAFGADRSTRDVDAAFEPTSGVRAAAAVVASSRGLPPDWLNDAVKGFVPPGRDPGQQVYLATEHLRVSVASAEYLLAMKVAASRVEADREDLRLLYRHLNLHSVEEALDIAESCFGPGWPMPPRAQYLLAEIADEEAGAGS